MGDNPFIKIKKPIVPNIQVKILRGIRNSPKFGISSMTSPVITNKTAVNNHIVLPRSFTIFSEKYLEKIHDLPDQPVKTFVLLSLK